MKTLVVGGLALLVGCANGSDLETENGALPPVGAGDAADGGASSGSPRASASSSGSARGGSSSGRSSSSGSSGASGTSSSGGSSSSGGPSIETGQRIEVPSGGALRTLESCWAVGTGTEVLALGTPMVFDAPASWHFEQVLGVDPTLIPGARLGAGDTGRRRLLVPFDAPVEWFLGFAVVTVQEGDDTANQRSCFFDMHALGWQHGRASHWGNPSEALVDKDLGTVSTTGGVVIEDYLEGDSYYRLELVAGAGNITPARTTTFDQYGLGALVFQSTTPGAYTFDLRRVHSGRIFRVRFQVR